MLAVNNAPAAARHNTQSLNNHDGLIHALALDIRHVPLGNPQAKPDGEKK